LSGATLGDLTARLARLPREPLLERPTPLEDAPRFARAAGIPRLLVKRDDAVPLGLGGNKLRSLEFWLGAAQAAGADTLVVAGGQASNQCRLTAAAAAKGGLRCHILYDGAPPADFRGNLRLARLFGAEMQFDPARTEAARPAALASAVERLRAEGRTPYAVGDPALGALGYVAAIVELAGQVSPAVPLDIFLAGSMGPTEAGAILGAALIGAPWRVVLVSVEYDEAELRRRVDAIAAAAAALLGLPCPPLDYRVRMDQLGPGYGIATAASDHARSLAGAAEALILEGTYTAKTLAGLLAAAADGTLRPGAIPVFWHTGGVPSALA